MQYKYQTLTLYFGLSGYPASSFISSKTAFSPRGLPAPPLFILLFYIFKKVVLTERVTSSTPFHPLVSYLQKRHFHREGYRAPPLFPLLFHIFKNGIFTERVTGSTSFHLLVSYLEKRHFHREGYRLHPFSSSCFISSKMAFSPRGLPAPLVSYLQKRHFHREGYRLHPFFILLFHIFKNGMFSESVTGSTPFLSSCFISSKTTFSPRGLPAPPLFIFLLHSFKNGVFTERVTGSTPFHPLVSYLQKRRFLRQGYRLHRFSSSCFFSSKTTFSPRR